MDIELSEEQRQLMETARRFVERECPLLVRSARYFQRPQWDETFALGLEALLAAASAGKR